MILTRLLLALALVTPFGLGCASGEGETAQSAEGVEDLTIVVEADKSRILQEEQSLNEKKEAVDQERERIEKERSDLEKRLATLSKKDKKQRDKLESDQARLEQEEKKLRERMHGFDTERTALEAEKNKLLDKLAQATQSKGGMTVAQREDLVARREKDLSRREVKVVEQEKEVAKLQTDAVRSLQEINKLLSDLQAGGGRTTVVAAPAPTGSSGKATRASVQKLQKEAKTKMETKGILVADLPPAARDLDKTAKTAVGASDWDAAHQALTELSATVDAMKIDLGFVQGKFARINRSYPKEKIQQLDEKKRKQVLTLLDEVSDAFSDGRPDRANRKINQLSRLLEGGE